MRSLTRAKILLVVALILGSSLSAVPARAADNANGLNLVVSPLPIDLVAKPGTSISTQLRVKNNGSEPETLKVSLLKFGAYGEDGKPRIMDPDPTDESVKWVKFSQTTFPAQPGEWKTVTMTITTPKSAAFDYYYAVTFSRAVTQQVKGKADLVGAVATLVLFEADVPNAKRNVDVLGFTSRRGIYEFLPADFSVRLRNSGNVHVAPHGNIFITHHGKNVGTIDINKEKGNILAGSNRIYTASWNDGFPHYVDKVENGKVVTNNKSEAVRKLQFDWNNLSHLRFGKYTANLTMVYDDGHRDVPVEAAVPFYVIPWRALLILIALLALVGFGFYSAIRGMRRPTRSRR